MDGGEQAAGRGDGRRGQHGAAGAHELTPSSLRRRIARLAVDENIGKQ
jgi:hypothetical protein